MKKLFSFLLHFLRLAVANTTSFPSTSNTKSSDITPDSAAMFGLISFRKNVNDYHSDSLVAVPTSSTQTPTLTVAQFLSNIIDFVSTASGAITLTTPTVAQILGALPATVPQNGFNYWMRIMNDATGQTITLTAGANVTLSATTATIATNTASDFLVNINVAAGTVTIVGIGGGLAL
jgi:hypothetical protein